MSKFSEMVEAEQNKILEEQTRIENKRKQFVALTNENTQSLYNFLKTLEEEKLCNLYPIKVTLKESCINLHSEVNTKPVHVLIAYFKGNDLYTSWFPSCGKKRLLDDGLPKDYYLKNAVEECLLRTLAKISEQELLEEAKIQNESWF